MHKIEKARPEVFHVTIKPDSGHTVVTTDELYDALGDLDGGLLIVDFIQVEDGSAVLQLAEELTDPDWTTETDFE